MNIVQQTTIFKRSLKDIFRAAIEYGLITFTDSAAFMSVGDDQPKVRFPMPDGEVTGHNTPEYLAQYWADTWATWTGVSNRKDFLFEAAMDLAKQMVEQKDLKLHAYLDTKLEVTQEERNAILKGNKEVLMEVIQSGRAIPNGAAYIPADSAAPYRYTGEGCETDDDNGAIVWRVRLPGSAEQADNLTRGFIAKCINVGVLTFTPNTMRVGSTELTLLVSGHPRLPKTTHGMAALVMRSLDWSKRALLLAKLREEYAKKTVPLRLRMGVDVAVSLDEANAIVHGDGEVLTDAIQEGQAWPSGNAYIDDGAEFELDPKMF